LLHVSKDLYIFIYAAYGKSSLISNGKTRTFKNLNATGLETRKGVWVGTNNLASATGLIMSILGSLTCEEDGNLSTRDLLEFIYIIYIYNPAGTPVYRNGTKSFFGLKGRPSVVRDV
jgi:hypothetical protein